MKTHIKLLAAVGAVASVAIVYGQAFGGSDQDQRRRLGGGGTQNGQTFSAASEAKGAEPLSTMQGIVARHMSAIQNHLINKYQDPKVTEAVIFGHCASQLTLRTKSQQTHEIEVVWAIDKWRPNGEWNSMRDVPSLVHELLRVDPQVEKEIQALEDKITAEFMKPLRDFIDRENLTSLPKDEANQRIYEWNQRELAKVPLMERSRRSVARSQQVIDFARTKLTKAQVAEMDKILGMFNEKMAVIEANAKKTN